MLADSAVAAVSDRRRRSEIDATIYVAMYNSLPQPGRGSNLSEGGMS